MRTYILYYSQVLSFQVVDRVGVGGMSVLLMPGIPMSVFKGLVVRVRMC